MVLRGCGRQHMHENLIAPLPGSISAPFHMPDVGLVMSSETHVHTKKRASCLQWLTDILDFLFVVQMRYLHCLTVMSDVCTLWILT